VRSAAVAVEPTVLFVSPTTASKSDIIKSICLIDSALGTDFNEAIFAPIGLDRMTRLQLVDHYRIKRSQSRRLGVLCFDDFKQLKSDSSWDIDF
jgi:hypothetical protein